MSVKAFVTSAKTVDDNETPIGETLVIEIDERAITLTPPTTGQWAVYLAGSSDTSSSAEMMASQINFFFSLLDEDDARYAKRRLFHRDDAFDVDNVAEILEFAMEEWSARPTKQPSDFLPSQSSNGKRSTAARHRSTQ